MYVLIRVFHIIIRLTTVNIWINLVPRAYLDNHDQIAEIYRDTCYFRADFELFVKLLTRQKIL